MREWMMSTKHVGDCTSQWHTTAMQRYLYYAVPRYARCAYLRADIFSLATRGKERKKSLCVDIYVSRERYASSSAICHLATLRNNECVKLKTAVWHNCVLIIINNGFILLLSDERLIIAAKHDLMLIILRIQDKHRESVKPET